MTDSFHSANAGTRSVQAHTPGHLAVVDNGQRQYAINNESNRSSEGAWDDIYVNFSGYFGSYGPHVFAAAPELLEAARDALLCLTGEYDTDSAHSSAMDALRSAIAKATGSAT